MSAIFGGIVATDIPSHLQPNYGFRWESKDMLG